MTPSRIGVTGASGFLGTSLVEHFSARSNVRIVAMTRTFGPEHVDVLPNVEWRQGDLTSSRDCASFVDGLDAIVHLAHTNTPLTSNNDLPSDALLNIVPTLNLLEAIRDAPTTPHLVYPSSGGALYRPSEDGTPVDEVSPVEPLTSYGIVKLTIEHYLRMAAAAGWLTATVLRIGNPYGVLLPPERLQGLIGVALREILEKRPIRVFGDLDNIRDYVHLADVCRAFDLALVHRRAFDVYNIGSGSGASVRDVLATLERVTGRTASVERVDPAGDPARLTRWAVLDSAKALRELGWRAEISLVNGVAAMWKEADR